MKRLALLSVIATLSAATAFAEGEHSMASGTVTKVDTEWNKVTIDHGPLENLDMPAMKMVFQVKEPSMIDGLAEGDSISFLADRVNGKLTIVELEKH